MLRNPPEKFLLPKHKGKEKRNATRGSKEPLGRSSMAHPLQPEGRLPRGRPNALQHRQPDTCTQTIPHTLGEGFMSAGRKESPFRDF